MFCCFFTIQETKDMKAIHLHPDPQLPKVLFLSIWSSPETWFICCICQKGCTGGSLYSSATSDLYRIFVELGVWWCMERRNSPRCWRLSRGYPDDVFSLNHAVEGVFPCTLVSYHAKVSWMWFGNSKDWHAVHAREEFISKRFREMTLEEFMILLVLWKFSFIRVVRIR